MPCRTTFLASHCGGRRRWCNRQYFRFQISSSPDSFFHEKVRRHKYLTGVCHTSHTYSIASGKRRESLLHPAHVRHQFRIHFNFHKMLPSECVERACRIRSASPPSSRGIHIYMQMLLLYFCPELVTRTITHPLRRFSKPRHHSVRKYKDGIVFRLTSKRHLVRTPRAVIRETIPTHQTGGFRNKSSSRSFQDRRIARCLGISQLSRKEKARTSSGVVLRVIRYVVLGRVYLVQVISSRP